MKKHVLYFSLLLCALCASPWRASAQAPDGEKLAKGARLKPDQPPVTIYADYLGQPNPFACYCLDDRYFFKVNGDSVIGCAFGPAPGKEFTKISIPGDPTKNPNQKTPLQRADQGRPYRDNVAYPPCPDSFPALSLEEKLVSPKELDRVFWILTSELVDNFQVVGEANLNHVNLKKFDKTYIHSRFFAAGLVVPFRYRFASGAASSFTGESTIGPAIGWTLLRDKSFDNRLWVVVSGGLTVINPNSAFDDAGTAKEKNMAGASACIGIGTKIDKTQVGIVFGYDFADPSWEYHQKPWLSFSVGFQFLHAKGNNGDNPR